MTRRLNRLADAISTDVVDPVRGDDGWKFSPVKSGCTSASILGADFLRDVYTAADPEYVGGVTVPVLWDRDEETIVNNQSIEIMRGLDSTFNGRVDLYPVGYREEFDRIIEMMYVSLNNGVYRLGFAKSLAAYEAVVAVVFDALDHWRGLRQATVSRRRPTPAGRSQDSLPAGQIRRDLPYTLQV